MLIVPKVVMNGLIFNRVTMTPLIQPTVVPAAKAARTAGTTGMPFFMATAETRPHSDMFDPTDMSNAPQTMTIVIPITISPSLEEFSRMFNAVLAAEIGD